MENIRPAWDADWPGYWITLNAVREDLMIGNHEVKACYDCIGLLEFLPALFKTFRVVWQFVFIKNRIGYWIATTGASLLCIWSAVYYAPISSRHQLPPKLP